MRPIAPVVALALIIFSNVVSAASDQLALLDLAAQQAMAQWAKYSFFTTVAGLILSAAGLVALLISLRHTRIATAAAESAAKVAKDALSAETRAWVSVDCMLSPPELGRTQSGDEGIYFNVMCKATNHGASPATSVTFHAKLSLLGAGSASPNELLSEYCGRIRARVDHDAGTIFPGADIGTEHMVFLSHADIRTDIAQKDFKVISPVVYGCINYKSPHVDGIRQTRFLYHVTTCNNQGQAMVLLPETDGWLAKPIVLTQPEMIIAD
ncbi:hypothetical protein [Methylomagnum ishizawai]|uniref:hypothetical protein n=1 Tax=Methylomagnum ishizawai TaxID=1760988 RepID=UPI001C324481|nr:hypothetical protein [Methylomagnum ishizawai]BBL73984.1 hypothetical protein MishRS11D_10820 [Methylomagnum ishizawai]